MPTKKKSEDFDETLITAFLTNYRNVDIAKATGLHKNTISKYRNDPDFQRVLNERRSAVVEAVVEKMRSYIDRDVEILQEIIDDPETPRQIKVNAIQLLFNQFSGLSVNVDLTRRLEALQKDAEGFSMMIKG